MHAGDLVLSKQIIAEDRALSTPPPHTVTPPTLHLHLHSKLLQVAVATLMTWWCALQEKLPSAIPDGEPLPEGLLWLLLTGDVCHSSCLCIPCTVSMAALYVRPDWQPANYAIRV